MNIREHWAKIYMNDIYTEMSDRFKANGYNWTIALIQVNNQSYEEIVKCAFYKRRQNMVRTGM